MKIFISMQDLDQLGPQESAYDVVKRHLNRMADMYPENGYLILIEKIDMGKHLALPELNMDLPRIYWEGVTKNDGYYHAVYLTNNEFALEFLLADADWLDEELRESLMKHLVGNTGK